MKPANLRPTAVPPDEGRLRAALWGAPFLIGLLVLVAGVFCFIAAGVTSLASILVFGVLLFLGGAAQIVYAFRRRKSGQFLLYFLAGLLSMVVGGLFVANPLTGLAAVTLLLAGYFFASGLFRAITSVMDRYRHWGLDLFSGLVSVALGVILVAQWPLSSIWLLGVLVAVELVTHGAMMMAMALAIRREERAALAA